MRATGPDRRSTTTASGKHCWANVDFPVPRGPNRNVLRVGAGLSRRIGGVGGIRGGIEHGRTDEYSYNIIDQNGQRTTRFEDDAVHVNDLNATILNQLGIDHRRLTFRFQGLEQRLTGVEEAHVVEKILS